MRDVSCRVIDRFRSNSLINLSIPSVFTDQKQDSIRIFSQEFLKRLNNI